MRAASERALDWRWWSRALGRRGSTLAGDDLCNAMARVEGKSGATLAADHETVQEQQDDRADDGAEEACTLAGPVPSHGLPEIGCDERADNSQNGRQDEALGLVLAGHEELGDHADNKSNDNRPDNAH